jgi:hypothetical protein
MLLINLLSFCSFEDIEQKVGQGLKTLPSLTSLWARLLLSALKIPIVDHMLLSFGVCPLDHLGVAVGPLLFCYFPVFGPLALYE